MLQTKTVLARRQILRAAKAHVRRAHADPDLSLSDVAKAAGTSPRHLQRVFREQGSEDFRTYLLRVRLERAVTLLTRERNPLPIHRVARLVGYRQHSGFRQAFVRFYGYNPSTLQAPPTGYDEEWRSREQGPGGHGARAHLV